MKKILSLALVMFIGNFVLIAQSYNINAYHGQTITSCLGNFYDSGGPTGNYSANESFTTTLCPNIAGASVRLAFTSFNINPSDGLTVYDGMTTAANAYGTFDGTNAPGMNPVGMIVGASVLNATGCITLEWNSSSTSSSPGWDAAISCGIPCQPFYVELDNSQPLFSLDTNVYYIDICPGDIISLCAKGDYFSNDVAYHQADTTTTFFWDFGNGVLDTGRCVSVYYDSIAGYNIHLMAIDSNGCLNTNVMELRVRISSNPIVSIAPLPPICLGDSLRLTVGEYSTNSIVLQTPSNIHDASLNVADTVYLPDGSGASYFSSVTFTQFNPGLTLSNINDFISVWAILEHSYLGDLHISISCPNGQSSTLKAYPGGSNTFLGEAIDNNAQQIPGLGWTYRWTPLAPPANVMGVMAGASYAYTDALGNAKNATIMPPSTAYPVNTTATPSSFLQDYAPSTSFNTLLGCPLNGTWTITITDNLGIDNGYIFSWGLELSSNLLPNSWSYEVAMDTTYWAGALTPGLTSNIVYAKPTQAGLQPYTLTVVDEFGCSWDTTFNIDVVERPSIHLPADTAICDGESITLDASCPSGDTYLWNTGSSNAQITIDSTASYEVTVTNTLGAILCSSRDVFNLTVNDLPVISFAPSVMSGCEPVSVDFTNFTTPVNCSYFWHFGDGTSSSALSPTHLFNSQNGVETRYTIFIGAVSPEGCRDSLEVTDLITVHPNPIANFTGAILPARSSYPNVDFTDLTTGNPTIWNWDFDDLASGANNTSTFQHPSHTFEGGEGFYSVRMAVSTSPSPCTDTAYLQVEVIDDRLEFPNVITPNGDGFNDVFEIINIENYKNNSITIYNRWGSRVFHESPYQGDWAPKNKGAGPFYYVLELKDDRSVINTYRGTIDIVVE